MNFPSRRARRWALALGALATSTMTHWPGLAVQEVGPIERADLIAHVVFFFTLGSLAHGAELFGPVGSRRNTLLTWLCSLAYAAIDEGTQAIPALKRTTAWDDLLANSAGLTLAALAALALGRALRARAPSAPPAG